ncbi:MAG TPA: ABC transporter permease [Thermoplasmata archaeon]|nr:ABC transporter permease [Thermoplasmata archaeon]
MSPPASSEVVRLRPGSSALGAVAGAVGQVATIVGYEARKLRHDPTELLLRAIQPALWLVVFGSVFSAIHVIPTGSLSYLEFLTPGILAQSVLFIAIFYGIASIRERELGIIIKFLVSPTPRTILVGGKALSASLRGLSQAVVVLLLAWGLGVRLPLSPLSVLGVIGTVVLGAALFSTLSMVIASLVRTQERFLGIGQLLTMPLFFASNAIYPISIMPPWLRPFALANPLTYLVDALRNLMLPAGSALYPLGVDVGVLAAVALGLIVLCAALYPRMAQ